MPSHHHIPLALPPLTRRRVLPSAAAASAVALPGWALAQSQAAEPWRIGQTAGAHGAAGVSVRGDEQGHCRGVPGGQRAWRPARAAPAVREHGRPRRPAQGWREHEEAAGGGQGVCLAGLWRHHQRDGSPARGDTGQGSCGGPRHDPFGKAKATLAAFHAAAKAHNNKDWKAFLLPETPDGVARVVDEITAWQPNALISLAVGIPFYQPLRQRVKAPAFSISFLGSRPLLAALGESARGITVAQVAPNPDNVAKPIVKAYRDALKRSAADAEPGYSSLEGYLSARLMIEALRRAGRTASREKLIEALHSMRPYDMGGFELRYGPQDHNGADFAELSYFNGERFRR